MREMGQSAWLSTSYPPYRAQRERVNARETGAGCNNWISYSNNYSVWPPRIEALESSREIAPSSVLQTGQQDHTEKRGLTRQKSSSKAAGESNSEAYPEGYLKISMSENKLATFSASC